MTAAQLPIDVWQERLQEHFSRLRDARATRGLPVFAIEHGLEQEDLDKIFAVLRSRLKSRLPQNEHWLLWVIYATELGYRYAGDEYWISFEEQTPGWITAERVSELVGWFRKFQKQYGGVVPSGDWANHFKRIALPITNALLPRYLQRIFAQTIFGLRYELVQLQSGDARGAGQLLASNAWNAPARFQEFLQQEELAGRILLSLLDEEPSDASPILQTTLDRIIKDLESVREARDWLRATRRHVADRFKGTGRDVRTVQRIANDRPLPAQAVERLKPKLLLRRDGPTTWTPLLLIPDFTDIGRANLQLMSFLRQTRARVNGLSDNWMPAGWTLGGAKARVLKSWPDNGSRLVTFETDNSALNAIMDGDFRFADKASWLLHVSSDGLAREVEAGNVRPGEHYVYLCREELPIGNPLLSPCTVNCNGVVGSILKCPASLSEDDIRQLQTLRLQISQSVRIWPSGLSARAWDGEGHSEWLTTENPCFGIVHDHPVDSYDVQIDGVRHCTIQPSAPGEPAFLSISQLSPGVHRLDVVANRSAPASTNRPGAELKGYINLVVRDPRPWIAGTVAHAGLVVTLDPPQPNLEEFWEGETALSVLGPEKVQVRCNIELINKTGAAVLTKEVAAFDLPLTASHWSSKFQKFVDHDNSPWAFTEAASGRLTIKTEELGNFVLTLERPHTPLRWYCRTIQRATSVRLLDDTGVEGSPHISQYTFHRPALASPLPSSLLNEGMTVDGTGGLFHSSHGGLFDSLVVSTKRFEGGLQGLLIVPDLSDLTGADTNAILNVLQIWEPARVVGPFASQRKELVVSSLMQQLLAPLCGTRWIETERKCGRFDGSDDTRQEFEKAVGLPHSSGFLYVIRRDGAIVEPKLSEVCDWFSQVAERYSVCSDETVCAFALQLANQPANLRAKYKEDFGSLLNEVAGNAVLLRSARYFSLLARAQNQGRPVKWT